MSPDTGRPPCLLHPSPFIPHPYPEFPVPRMAVGRAAANLPWLCPNTTGLVGLAERPADLPALAATDPALLALLARVRNKLYDWRSLHRFAVAMGPAGFVAVIAGWITTEVGRQPFTVYGLLRTYESAAPLDAPAVGASLVAFVLVYFAVFGAGTIYILKLMSHAPHRGEAGLPQGPGSAPIRTAGITPSAQIDPEAHHHGHKADSKEEGQ